MNCPHPTRGTRRPASLAGLLALCVLLVVPALASCGKKGPPLAPLITVPGRPDPFTARRLGSVVYLQLTIPRTNQDGTSPADLRRVDVYGFTGNVVSNDTFVKEGTLVATLPVRQPPPEEEEPAQRQAGGAAGQAAPKEAQKRKPTPPAREEAGFDQGAVVTLTEPLTPAVTRPVVSKEEQRAIRARRPVAPPRVLLPPEIGPVPARVYIAVGVNHKGQSGAFSSRVAIPIVGEAVTPAAPTVTYTETAITVNWTPPSGARRAVQDADTADVLPSKARVPSLPPGAYNVYETKPPGGASPVTSPAPAPALPVLPAPLNDKPLTSTSFEDRRMQFGVERCYVVRTVDRYGAMSVESEASPPACVTPVDTFPPSAPRSLAAVASEGAINLIWEPNTETDLAGYLVLRGPAGSGTLQPITPQPVKETTYRDTTVQAGVRYTYAVVAVDTSKNVSIESNRVEESAR